MAAKKPTIPAKIKELLTQDWIRELNQLMDTNPSGRTIQNFCKSKGFNISADYSLLYKKYYKTKSTEEHQLDAFFNTKRVSDLAYSRQEEREPLSQSDKLKTDFEYMDLVIQAGAKNLQRQLENGDDVIRPADVFKAIELKDKLSEGAMLGFTEHGIKYLQEITEEKYIRIINHILKYIAPEVREQLLIELDQIEEDFYKETDYYEDYLRSRNYTESEISDKLYEKVSEANKRGN